MERKFLLTEDAIRDIEGKIGYTFKDKYLLNVAFTRKSYSMEHIAEWDYPSNEVLEFFGDSALNYIVAKAVSQWESDFMCNGMSSGRTEANYTYFISNMTDKTMLSSRMREMDIAKYLVMSNGDVKNRVNENINVMEDLFEAIIGAMWFDNGKNTDLISDHVLRMLEFDREEEEYYRKNAFMKLKEFMDRNPGYEFLKTVSEGLHREFELRHNGEVLSHIIVNGGPSEHSVVISVAQDMVDRLIDLHLWDQKTVTINMDEITLDNAINKLQELAQKKILVRFPRYAEPFQSKIDNMWYSDVYLDGTLLSGEGIASTKSEAKKQAAYDMLEQLSYDKTNTDYFNI